MNGDRWVTVVGFAAALVVLAVLVWLAGIDETMSNLARAEVGLVVVAMVFAAVWVASWGMSLHTVLGALGAPIPATKAVLLFSAAMFSNNITPFGQAGGEPVSAFLISEAADSEYETGLAAIASVDTLHFIPSIGLALAGLAALLLRATSLGQYLYFALASIGGLLAAFVTAALVGYRYRHEVEHIVAVVLTPILGALFRIVPGKEPPSAAAIESSVGGFFGSVDRIATDRRAVVVASAYSALGWLSLSAALWVSVYSIGVEVPFAAALFVIPIGSIAGFTPLPGGSGAIEGTFAAMLVTIGGISSGAAVAAVFVHRVATYWLPTFVGGGVAAMLGTQRRKR